MFCGKIRNFLSKYPKKFAPKLVSPHPQLHLYPHPYPHPHSQFPARIRANMQKDAAHLRTTPFCIVYSYLYLFCGSIV